MKAAVISKAGGCVEIEDRERPVPGPDEVRRGGRLISSEVLP